MQLGIILTTTPKKSTVLISYLIEDVLIIEANVDGVNHLVWYASIYFNGKHNEHPSREQLMSEVYPILEKFRRKNKMKWDKRFHQFFNYYLNKSV